VFSDCAPLAEEEVKDGDENSSPDAQATHMNDDTFTGGEADVSC
jgi:hypothetical protein